MFYSNRTTFIYYIYPNVMKSLNYTGFCECADQAHGVSVPPIRLRTTVLGKKAKANVLLLYTLQVM